MLNEKSFENRMRRLRESIQIANAQTERLKQMEQEHYEQIRLQRQITAISKAFTQRANNGQNPKH